MANFNRERIPERQPHAKGGGAFGYFEVANDVSAFTRAAVFQPGTKTETLIRFSTVHGERGSPDTWRDPRGFSLRFYTTEGNFDMVGNNTPVFCIRDPLKFQNFIRSPKRMQATNLRDNNIQWDFWTLSPESAHQVTWLMGDRGIPKTWRHMDGFSSHTYSWINADGEIFWVKYPFQDQPGRRLSHPGRVMRIRNATDPVYTPNSYGGPHADLAHAAEVHWVADGEMVRAAYTLRKDHDDWGQAGALVRQGPR